MFTSKSIVTVAIAAIACLSVAYAQVHLDGECPTNIKVVPDFNIEKYLGTWYEYAKYPVYFEQGGKCITAKYSLQSDGNVGVINSQVNEKTNIASDIVGYAKAVSNAKLLVTFPVSPAANTSSNYWVLDTDYTSYAVVYSCQPSATGGHDTIVWILTRESQPSLEVTYKAETVLVNNCVSLTNMVFTNQYNCNY